MMPKVSLILPTYNGERWLRQSIDSCLQQTFGDFELIVVVDGSTDKTLDILASYRDPRMVVITQQNQKLPQSLNNGFARARGTFWAWTSDDNLYLPDALAVMVRWLETHSRCPMVSTDCILIDDDDNRIGYSDNNWACFLYRAEVARKTGLYRPEFRLVEDVDFFLRLQHCAGPIENIREAHYLYRVHKQSLSHSQFNQRQLVSLRMHVDLVRNGIEQVDLRLLTLERLARAAIHRNHATMDELVTFVCSEKLPFAEEIAARSRFLKTKIGWALNRAQIAAISKYSSGRSRLRYWMRARRTT
jgi:glycosyltransferase involved in cell wall biosynthesis